MPNDRGVPSLLLIYVCVIGTLFVGAGFALMKVANTSNEMTKRASLEQTMLDQRIGNAREIRKALKKPLPPPEPLPAITARVQHAPLPGIATNADRRKPSREARDAFASAQPGYSSSIVAFDRFAPQ